MANKSFFKDTGAAKPLPSSIEGIFIRNVSADTIYEFALLGKKVEEATPNLSGNEKLTEEQVLKQLDDQKEAMYNIAWFLFERVICDEDGDPFDDVPDREAAKAAGIPAIKAIMDSLREVLIGEGKTEAPSNDNPK